MEIIHPALRNYRFDLFQDLNRTYSVKFIFTIQQVDKEFGGIQVPPNWNHEIINVENSRVNWFRLAKALLRDNYDLILTSPSESLWDFLALIISKIKGRKIIFWGESWYWPSHTLSRRIYFYILFKWMLNRGDAVIAMGEKQYSFYSSLVAKKHKIFCSPKYVIPYKEKDASELLERLAIQDQNIRQKKIVLYMSQVIERKGLDYLIRAFKLVEVKNDNIYLVIAGSGPFEDYCKKLANELNVRNIMFIGYIQDSDIEQYHNLANVLVLPSVFFNDYPEPDGYVLFESMSVGKPLVITNAVGATPELVRNGINGFVVKNRDIDQLANALSKILKDDQLEKSMSEKSREIFQEKISLQRQIATFNRAIEFVRKKIN